MLLKLKTAPTVEPGKHNKTCGVYKILCLTSGKIYIGSAVWVEKRWRGHKEELRKGTHVNKYLQNSWNKYGEDDFIFSLVQMCTKENLISIEQEYIDCHQAANREFGFNINPTAGSNLGKTFSSEIRAKMSIARMGKTLSDEAKEKLSIRTKGNKYNLGNKHTEETKRILKEKRKGKKPAMGMRHTSEAKAKISVANKGKSLSEDHRIKIADALKGKKQTKEHRDKIATIQAKLNVDKINQGIIWREEGIKINTICEKLGCSRQTFYNAINGKFNVYRRCHVA
jgi:hypothetical protein